MKRARILCTLAFALCALAGARAQEALTLETIRRQAIDRSNTLRRSALAIESARLGERIQSRERLPSISAQTGVGLSTPDEDGETVADTFSASAGLSVNQPIYQGGRQSALARQWSLETSVARVEWQAARRELLKQAEAAYYAVLQADAAVEAARSDLQAAQLHRTLVEAQLEIGTAARPALLETQANVAAKEAALRQAQGTLSVARARLAFLTGLEQPFTLQRVDFTPYEQAMSRFEMMDEAAIASLVSDILATARNGNPTLGRVRLAREQASLQVELDRTDYRPTVSAGLSWSFSADPVRGVQDGGPGLSLGISIPLSPWNRAGSQRQASIAVEQADLDLEEQYRELALDIQSAVYSLVAAAQSAASSGAALQYAEENYRSALELYRLGASTASALADAQALVSASRGQLIDSRYRFLTDLSTLRALAGLDSEEQLLAILP